MEEQQIKTIQELLATKATEVETGTRVYVSSKTYGDSRYHLLSKKHDSIQIEQTNIDDKWGSRVNLQLDQMPAVLSTLLNWYLQEVGQKPLSEDDSLGDLDDHSF